MNHPSENSAVPIMQSTFNAAYRMATRIGRAPKHYGTDDLQDALLALSDPLLTKDAISEIVAIQVELAARLEFDASAVSAARAAA